MMNQSFSEILWSIFMINLDRIRSQNDGITSQKNFLYVRTKNISKLQNNAGKDGSITKIHLK